MAKIVQTNKITRLTATHRAMGYTSFFHLAAQLVLSDSDLDKIRLKMVEILES